MKKSALWSIVLSCLFLLCACGAPARGPVISAPAVSGASSAPAETADASLPAPPEPTPAPDESAPAQAAAPTRETAPEPPKAAPAEETKPAPEPAPAEPSAPPAQAPEQAHETSSPAVTLSVSCAVLLDNMDKVDPDKAELVPADGWLLPPTQVSFTEGESVFDVLRRTCVERRLHMEFVDTPVYGSVYVEGIGNLYEFDAGPLSGWRYSVNGWYPNYGCSLYALSPGDRVEWVYALDPGEVSP